ncbi:MAG: hypothetical protein KC535_05080, partial [Nanoarchaeota archaeon]|nr:hypothetical protein [Nanoarchaeota archaeon]
MSKSTFTKLFMLFVLLMSLVPLANSANNTILDTTTNMYINESFNTPIDLNASNVINQTSTEFAINESTHKEQESRIIIGRQDGQRVTLKYIGSPVEQPVFRFINKRILYVPGTQVTVPETILQENTLVEFLNRTTLLENRTFGLLPFVPQESNETREEKLINETASNQTITERQDLINSTINESVEQIQEYHLPRKSIVINRTAIYSLDENMSVELDFTSLAKEAIGTNPQDIIYVNSELVDEQGARRAISRERTDQGAHITFNESLAPGKYHLTSSLFYNNRSYIHNIPLLIDAVQLSNRTLRLYNTTSDRSLARLEDSNGKEVMLQETLLNATATEIVPETGVINSLVVHSSDITSIEGDLIGLDTNLVNTTTEDNKTWLQAYAIDPSQADIGTIDLTVTAKGNALYKCAEWNFTTQTCTGEWTFVKTIIPGEPYTISVDKVDPAFGEQSTYLKTEWGAVSSLGDTWQTVNLTETYQRPVIIATPHYTSAGVPTVP